MALETLSSNELLNFIIYDTISATPLISTSTSTCNNNNDYSSSDTITTTTATAGAGAASTSVFLNNPAPPPPPAASAWGGGASDDQKQMMNNNVGGQQQAKKKRRRRPRVCKNKEEAENQRMTHIAVERNRRKQMNEHLAVLRSLMPESYVQRGDQASIVGGAIEFVKELEHLLQSLEAQKFIITRQRKRHHRDQQQEQEEEEEVLSNIEHDYINNNDINAVGMINMLSNHDEAASPPLFSQFFSYPQYTYSQIPNKHTSKSKAAMADIEVTLIETHANLRILSRKRLTQLSKMVACFQTLYLSILHLNVTTLDPFVLYSISTKVEEGCRLNSADEIAGAVNQMLRIIEEESTLC